VKKVTNFTILIIPVLIEAFFEEEICLRTINTSHITLIPKKDGPSTAADYRPISLLNTSFKLITKVLANRLQKIIRQNTTQKSLWIHQDQEYSGLPSLGPGISALMS